MKFRMILLSAAAAMSLTAPVAAKPDYVADIKADYDKSLGMLWDHFHRNPELSFREFKAPIYELIFLWRYKQK